MLKKCWLEKVISEFTVHIVTIYYISCFYMQADLTFGVKHLYTFFTICTLFKWLYQTTLRYGILEANN